MDNTPQKSAFHSFATTSSLQPMLVILVVVVVGLGLWTGYFLASRSSLGASSKATINSNGQVAIQKGAVYGSDDTTTFKDTVEGIMQKGGINGEGQFHLVRPGGDSQNVYMTSSLVDLSLFIGRKVKVWGQTQKSTDSRLADGCWPRRGFGLA